ncbi:hypothetical protein ABFS82_O000600 [Erythranthe guttata]|uniref:F-box domain-containing protein n=1 Tax=Erythranthe guttata TaxID=4155 RepID=A0A022S1F9_ERYGU|nr:PREDICTED: FBD-associated F-box protein At5g38590-like [Erythranthe guttata]EYU45743.1 hypothetical protein MIMGU_mgv11b018472mg [Erythranthe guttata]|eukprot:XP_012839842.1 PREDICTED: FBD-associated F-box protein At5g38590-like [Erythranthe guttata]
MDRISELPKDILHRILYFLSPKQVVRTSVLSKSWRYDWCTRPNLDFSDMDFIVKMQESVSTVNNILQRYYDQRLCIQKLHRSLLLDNNLDRWVSLLKTWTPLLTLTGLKKFRLVYFGGMPAEVFGAESLEDLHLEGFTFDEKGIERMVVFKRLRSLCLRHVKFEDDVLQKIIASCPLIETLNVEGYCDWEWTSTIKLNDLRNLKNLKSNIFTFEIHPPSLETIDIRCGDIRLHRGAVFYNLRDLYLARVGSSLDHLSSCKFPRLECLDLYDCGRPEEIQLFIDAPNIVCFKCNESRVPSISFATTSREWKSDISLTPDEFSSSWFLKIKELLKSLSRSKISLTIGGFDYIVQENINTVQDNDCDNPVVVECLRLDCPYPLSSFSYLLNVTFGICRPRNIGNFHEQADAEFVAFQWKILMQRESENQDEFAHLLFRDLEDVSFEMKERNREDQWRPASLSEFILNCRQSESRFALKWRETL